MAKLLVLVVHLSFLLLSSSTLLANALDLFSWTHSTHPPAAAPAPHHHKGHHHHHHHHHMTQPPVHSPSLPPVHPPKHVSPVPTPSHAHTPVHPPKHVSPVPTPSHAHAPVHPPSHAHAPVHAHPPVHPPMPARKFVAVQGVVYCKSCKYTGVETLLGATPLLGAVVKLQCNNTKTPLVQKAKTDKNGYFMIMAPKTLTTYAYHKCKVTLVSSPMATCNNPTNLHYGLKGAVLIPSIKPRVPPPHLPTSLPYQVFNVGPFAFEPSAKTPCPRGGV